MNQNIKNIASGCRYFFVLTMYLGTFTESVLAEVESTTSLGLMNRSLELNLVASDEDDESSTAEINTAPEELSGLAVCERVAASSSFGLKFATGGCILTGGLKTMYSVLSVQLSLIYYPLSKKGAEINDVGLSTEITEISQFYIIGSAGFSKITSKQSEITNVSVATDVLDFGGGVGYSYNITKRIQVVGEAQYMAGSIISTVAKGTTSSILVTGGIGLTL